jgi:alkyl hydroperoxide reductase subunit AhpC
MTQGAVVSARAPDFSLLCTAGFEASRRRVNLADYRDRWLMILFYPRDFGLV